MSPNAGGWGDGGGGVPANEYSCAHGAQINFRDLTPYLTYEAGKRYIFPPTKFLEPCVRTLILPIGGSRDVCEQKNLPIPGTVYRLQFSLKLHYVKDAL